jgi:cytochrome b involved in lipid metabolism
MGEDPVVESPEWAKVMSKSKPEDIVAVAKSLGMEADLEKFNAELMKVAPPAPAGYTMDDVALHTAKEDCWIVINGQVLDVTTFIPKHPGGEIAIMAFAGKDASSEWNMIHKPDWVQKFAPECILGPLEGGSANTGGGENLLDKAPSLEDPEELEVSDGIGGMLYAFFFVTIRELVNTVFINGNFRFVFYNDRSGLTRSAFFLIVFIIIHGLGNLHLFSGKPDFNGYGHMFVRLYWTGFGLNANIVEEYLVLALGLHVAVALYRTWDISLGYSIASGKLNLALSGLFLLMYLVNHLQDFRFGQADDYSMRAPPYPINLNPAEWPHFFYTRDKSQPLVVVRDIYKLEFILFSSPLRVLYYTASTLAFFAHFVWGWTKVVPCSQLGLPKKHHDKIRILGHCIGACIVCCYVAFPWYCYFHPGEIDGPKMQTDED